MRYIFLFLFFLLVSAALINYAPLKNRLKGDLKAFRPVHWAWIILFFAIVNFGKIESDSLIVSNSVQLLLVPIAGIIILFSFFNRLKYALANVNLATILMILYASSGILSGMYSPYPAFSTYKATLVLVATLAGILAISYSPKIVFLRRFVDLNYFFYFLLLFSFVIGAIMSPAQAMIYKEGMSFAMIKGWIIKTNPNGLGFLTGVLGLAWLVRLLSSQTLKKRFMYFSFFLVATITTAVAQSRTCVAGFALSLIVILLLKKKIVYLIILLAIGISSVTVDTLREGIIRYYRRGQTEKQVETWTGRLTTWKYSWGEFMENPILGYGMAAGIRFGAVSEALKGTHMHSSYFEILLNSGLIGFIPWFVSLLLITNVIMWRIFSPPAWFTPELRDFHIEIAAVLIFGLVRSVAGTTFVFLDHTMMLFVSLLAYSALVRKKNMPPEEIGQAL